MARVENCYFVLFLFMLSSILGKLNLYFYLYTQERSLVKRGERSSVGALALTHFLIIILLSLASVVLILIMSLVNLL